jgi:hypothetical protein
MTTPAPDPRAFYDLGHQGDVDVTLIEHSLRLTPAQRVSRLEQWRGWPRKDARMNPQFVTDTVARLVDGRVEFLIVGGVCAVLHGSNYVTQDLDLCYRRTPDNIERLAASLAPLKPRPRGFPPELPFAFDARTIQLGCNFTFLIGEDPLDLLGEMSAVGGYEQVIGAAIEVIVADRRVKILALEDLIATKAAAGRPKDLLALTELRPLLELKRKQGGATNG